MFQPAEIVSLVPRMSVPTSLMLGRKPCPSPAAKSNSITKARNDETTKSNQDGSRTQRGFRSRPVPEFEVTTNRVPGSDPLSEQGPAEIEQNRRSRRGGFARAQAAAHFSRIRAITTRTADSVWALRSRRVAFASSEPSFAAKLRVLCELLFNDPGQSHVAGGVRHAMICKLRARRECDDAVSLAPH